MKTLFLTLSFFAFSICASAQNVGIGTPTPSDQLHTTGTVRFEKYKGPSARMMQIDSSGRLVVTAAGAVALNTTAYAVADNGCAAGTGITSAIIISGQPTAVPSSKIAVRINMTHTFDADLKIFLIPPGGGSVLALADNAGSSGDNFTNTIFTDQALISVMAVTAPFTGQYRPSGNTTGCLLTGTVLANFAGIGGGNIVPNGTWTLRIFDNAGGDIGTLNNWSISFTGAESITTADENNYIPKFSAGNLVASSIYQPAGSNNIGIGTTTPTAKLEVNGTMKITDGTQGDKKVLTSDAAGNATWQAQAYGNTERFQFYRVNSNTEPSFVSSVYNFGTVVLLPAQDRINFTVNVSGLYHFDINCFARTTMALPFSSIMTIDMPGGRLVQSIAAGAVRSPTSNVSSIDKSFDVYLTAPASFIINFFAPLGDYFQTSTVTSHLISQ